MRCFVFWDFSAGFFLMAYIFYYQAIMCKGLESRAVKMRKKIILSYSFSKDIIFYL